MEFKEHDLVRIRLDCLDEVMEGNKHLICEPEDLKSIKFMVQNIDYSDLITIVNGLVFAEVHYNQIEKYSLDDMFVDNIEMKAFLGYRKDENNLE